MINSKILGEVLIKISKSKNGEKSIEAFFDYLKKKNFVGFFIFLAVNWRVLWRSSV